MSGALAWFVWRTLYLTKLVGFGNKVRVVLDWTLDLLVGEHQPDLRQPVGPPAPRPAAPVTLRAGGDS